MDYKQQTKKIGFCCPHHGVLSEPVEYFSVDIGYKKIVDVSVMRCPQCKTYYTPFTNLLALTKIEYKGHQVAAGQPVGRKGIARVDVRVPYIISIEEYNQRNEQAKKEQVEKNRKYIEDLREVEHNCIILTNKNCFISENKCPCCHEKTKKEYVKIIQYRKFLLANVRHCSHCDFDYISPEQFERIREKASSKIRGYYRGTFVFPVEIECEYQEDGKYLYIPKWALDFEKYDHHHLPPRGDTFYDMTDEEYRWVVSYHQPEDFSVQLRHKSFLGEAGYSTSESEVRRHNILKTCVSEYGKSRVINQLKSNMNLRIKQKDGDVRYAHALNIWREDIWWVENEL